MRGGSCLIDGRRRRSSSRCRADRSELRGPRLRVDGRWPLGQCQCQCQRQCRCQWLLPRRQPFPPPRNPPMAEGQQHLKLPNSYQHQQLPARRTVPTSPAAPTRPLTPIARVRTGSPSPGVCHSVSPPHSDSPPVAQRARRAVAKQQQHLPPSSPSALLPLPSRSLTSRAHPTSPTLHILARPQPRKPLQSFRP